jgi:hypothetical protein
MRLHEMRPGDYDCDAHVHDADGEPTYEGDTFLAYFASDNYATGIQGTITGIDLDVDDDGEGGHVQANTAYGKLADGREFYMQGCGKGFAGKSPERGQPDTRIEFQAFTECAPKR